MVNLICPDISEFSYVYFCVCIVITVSLLTGVLFILSLTFTSDIVAGCCYVMNANAK